MWHQLLVALKKPFIKMVPVATPHLECGANKSLDVARFCQQLNIKKPLIVTESALVELGLLDNVASSFDQANIGTQLFERVTPDPSFELVREGVTFYNTTACDGIIALGGGSAIDCAKAIAASVSTRKDVSRLTGLLKVRRRVLPIIALPTTAGTGSEATVAAVVSDRKAQRKYSITDPFLVPKVAIIDPTLMLGLPQKITAETGIDALTHAIESYLSGYANRTTRALSLSAIERIFRWLPKAFFHGEDCEAREQMALASYEAGLVFTRTYIGYVHAIAHQLGAIYHTPHGLANALVLVHVLRFIAQRNNPVLIQLAVELGFSGSEEFIARIEAMLSEMGVASQLDALKPRDVEIIAAQALAEAFGEYPVPEVMSQHECETLVAKLLPQESQRSD
ncbi:iron-containing alcohol dehydrogenase [Vibrio sp. JPW-9-11-11]|uniref:iron-containing alcohol dehydrogenase n=1 Tax=Vibrio sp. JPW-9-11-11 TaxID=1416532 RepID=UPI001593B5CE|nr:iron-containing alcohol dehydrogenase [Vibrio sp. JPW-9-11-11]NVD06981.1 iron-containing alcohol dehydrogenase [Vibrio sp. JPW-9-11-11]